MTVSPAQLVINNYCEMHETILEFLQKLSDEQLGWQLPSGSLPIAWHGWHLARWADHIQACVPGMSPVLGSRLAPGVQLWQAEGFAAQWGWNPAELGYAETGMYMADEVALNLSFPPKDELLDYIGRAFARANEIISTISDDEFQMAEQPQPLTEGVWGEGTVGEAVMSHLTHDCRHLGMMEALLGLQGVSGSAGKYQ
jgi:hypothetical protein